MREQKKAEPLRIHPSAVRPLYYLKVGRFLPPLEGIILLLAGKVAFVNPKVGDF
jgi:hypothetical protein